MLRRLIKHTTNSHLTKEFRLIISCPIRFYNTSKSRTILFCYGEYFLSNLHIQDGSKYSKHAYETAFQFLKPEDKIILFNVYIPLGERLYISDAGLPHQWVKETEAKQIAALREEMKEFKKIAEERGFKNTEDVIVYGQPKSEIIKYIEENNVDLAVVGSHGLSALQYLFATDHYTLGSISNYVVAKAKCDVLVVKPRTTIN